jgi:hypothetical protein
MRPKAKTRRNDWVQLGMGAGALLLPPLALGAALYSMLAPPDEDATRPAVAQAAVPEPAPAVLPVAKSADDGTRSVGRAPIQGESAQSTPAQIVPIQIGATTAAAASPPPGDAEGSAAPPAADNPPAAPKRPVHRRARPQEDPFPLKKWLQQMGILPPNAKDGRG